MKYGLLCSDVTQADTSADQKRISPSLICSFTENQIFFVNLFGNCGLPLIPLAEPSEATMPLMAGPTKDQWFH